VRRGSRNVPCWQCIHDWLQCSSFSWTVSSMLPTTFGQGLGRALFCICNAHERLCEPRPQVVRGSQSMCSAYMSRIQGCRGTGYMGLPGVGASLWCNRATLHPCILSDNTPCDMALLWCMEGVQATSSTANTVSKLILLLRAVLQTSGWPCSSIRTSCRGRISDSKARPGER